jgi:hypothetical protein
MVRLDVAAAHLVDRDSLALRKLIECASWIDRIYWKQRSEGGWRLKQMVADSADADSRELERLIDLNFGPWDSFDNDRPFWGDCPRPPGGNLYPADLTRAELDRYVARHSEQRQALLSHTTLVRRDGDRLAAIPYEEAYKEELAHVAQGLIEASDLVTHAGFAAFLRARAHDLVAGSYRESDTRWIDVADSPIDIAIGPYEVYDDTLLGRKTSYEATVMVRHPMTELLARFEAVASDLEPRLPGAVAPPRSRRRVVIGVYDVAYTAGMTNMGGKAVAATLPNDERVRTEVGARLLLFRNVISAKFTPILKPLGQRLLHPDQVGLVREDAFLTHTLLHEMAHALATCFVSDGAAATGQTTNEALRERYSTIEECRADLMGLVFLDLLTRRGLFPSTMTDAAAVTFVVGGVRTLRFGASDDYSRGGAIILSHLLRKGAVKADTDGRLVVDVDGVQRGVGELAETVQHIATRGDYEAAGRLIDDLGALPTEVQRLLPDLADIPIDLEFVFDDSLRAR